MIPSGSGRCPENRFRPGSRIVHLPGKTGNRITGIRFRPDTRYFCYDGSFSAALRRGRCRARLFATKERYRCGLPLAGTHRPFFEPILFFLCQKEKNGFNLPRKERGPVRTVVLNLTLKISDSSCPLHQTLPPERSLRAAHRGVRRSQLHSASAGAAKAPYPLAPSSFPNCDRCAGSQFGTGGQSRPPLQDVTYPQDVA